MNEANQKEACDPMLKPYGLLACLLASPLFLLFIHLGEPERGVGAWICVTSILFAVRARKELITEGWFWITIAVLLVLQVPITLLVPWPKSENPLFLVLTVVVTIDNFLIYGSIRRVEKLMKRGK
jgi:hypothetical protein